MSEPGSVNVPVGIVASGSEKDPRGKEPHWIMTVVLSVWLSLVDAHVGVDDLRARRARQPDKAGRCQSKAKNKFDEIVRMRSPDLSRASDKVTSGKIILLRMDNLVNRKFDTWSRRRPRCNEILIASGLRLALWRGGAPTPSRASHKNYRPPPQDCA